ncbi:MAG: hypothetical protein EA385_14735 [Salinarimonadaceae bacterium]|nr:MAG: hypothetical protein EA385_14735 [Salinarimonadaceae bacterium]
MAVRLSGSRYGRLANLRTPTLIIHGKADPLVPIAHGRRLVEAIPGARAFWPDDMGHDISEHLVGSLVREMVKHFEYATVGATLTGLVDGGLSSGVD